MDRAAIALEGLRTQWRSAVQLGTHERMTISQLRVYGSMPMSELASRIALSRAAVTSLIDRLEAEGWVRRTPDPSDRRRTVLALEPRAETEFTRTSLEWNEFLRSRAGELDAESFQAVVAFLSDMTHKAEELTIDLRANEGGGSSS